MSNNNNNHNNNNYHYLYNDHADGDNNDDEDNNINKKDDDNDDSDNTNNNTANNIELYSNNQYLPYPWYFFEVNSLTKINHCTSFGNLLHKYFNFLVPISPWTQIKVIQTSITQ